MMISVETRRDTSTLPGARLRRVTDHIRANLEQNLWATSWRCRRPAHDAPAPGPAAERVARVPLAPRHTAHRRRPVAAAFARRLSVARIPTGLTVGGLCHGSGRPESHG